MILFIIPGFSSSFSGDKNTKIIRMDTVIPQKNKRNVPLTCKNNLRIKKRIKKRILIRRFT